MNNLLQASLDYLSQGFSIIPVKKDKRPLLKWEEYQKRLPTSIEVEGWFKKSHVDGIAIVTGAISGVVVVDVEKGGNIEDLPKTIMVQTGGDGWHLYYKYNPNIPVRNYGRIKELTDIRGDGGYVIVPPSLHKSGKQYTWLTPMDRALLVDFPNWLISTSSSVSSQSTQCSQAIATSVSEGVRNNTAAKEAGKILRYFNPGLWESSGWTSLLGWNSEKCKPPLDKKELRTIWDSIVKREQEKRREREKERKDEQNTAEIYWKRPNDGRIVEAYYDSCKEETGLLVYEDGDVIKTPSIVIKGITYVAPPPTNQLIKPGFVSLPSESSNFSSEATLLQEVKSFIHDYVQIPLEFEDLTAFYVLFSWVYDDFQELPYLRAIGDYGSGKSRFLKIMGALCYRSIFLNGAASASAIFRIIHEVKGTVILDEADFRLSDTSNEIVKILNSGFQKGIPVFRSEASGKNMKSYDPTPFDVFCPKVIATRKNFKDDALESRCLSNPMETLTREDIPENLDGNFDDRSLKLRNKLVMFRFLKLSRGFSNEGLPKIDIEPRLKQIISPIYRVITDSEGRKIIFKFIYNKQREVKERRFVSLEGEVLQSLVHVLEANVNPPSMEDIAKAYNDLFGGKYPIKAKKIGLILDQTFHLEKKRGAKGFLFSLSKENENRLEKLKLKFGLSEPEMNIVNNVNIEERVDDVADVGSDDESLPF